MYCISITKYLVALYQVWCSYHNHVGEVSKVRILWHHNGPFGLLLGHFYCFFKGVRPSLNGPTCCPPPPPLLICWALIVLAHFLFPIRWSQYSCWCNGTCKDRYLSFPNSIMGYPYDVPWGYLITCLAFWKSLWKKNVLQLALQFIFWIAKLQLIIYTMQVIAIQLQLSQNNSSSTTIQLHYNYTRDVMLTSNLTRGIIKIFGH